VIAAPYYYCCFYCFYEAKLCLRKFILLLSFSQWTPLHFSAANGHLEVARLLLQCNADVKAKTYE
jgi:ankyrin repeat protein